MPQYFFDAETAVVVAISTAIFTGIMRMLNGGSLLDPDRAVRDGIAGVVVFVMSMLWYGLIYDMGTVTRWSVQPLGMLTISMAMFGLILSRLQTIYKSCMNKS